MEISSRNLKELVSNERRNIKIQQNELENLNAIIENLLKEKEACKFMISKLFVIFNSIFFILKQL